MDYTTIAVFMLHPLKLSIILVIKKNMSCVSCHLINATKVFNKSFPCLKQNIHTMRKEKGAYK